MVYLDLNHLPERMHTTLEKSNKIVKPEGYIFFIKI